MTKVPQEDLLIEWRLYGPEQQKAIFLEYKAKGGNPCSEEDFHNFLRKRLEIFWLQESVPPGFLNLIS